MNKIGEILIKFSNVCQSCCYQDTIIEQCYGWKVAGEYTCKLKQAEQEIIKLIGKSIEGEK
ncbi:MAG: hypothetical protein Q8M94_02175 [Ignavibacteria bacterium]|nr:hypothetical protein [Ignavibacteria bacterium]